MPTTPTACCSAAASTRSPYWSATAGEALCDYLGHRDVLNAPQFFNYSLPTDNVSLRAYWTNDGWTPDAVIISLGTNDWNLQKSDPISEKSSSASTSGWCATCANTIR